MASASGAAPVFSAKRDVLFTCESSLLRIPAGRRPAMIGACRFGPASPEQRNRGEGNKFCRQRTARHHGHSPVTKAQQWWIAQDGGKKPFSPARTTILPAKDRKSLFFPPLEQENGRSHHPRAGLAWRRSEAQTHDLLGTIKTHVLREQYGRTHDGTKTRTPTCFPVSRATGTKKGRPRRTALLFRLPESQIRSRPSRQPGSNGRECRCHPGPGCRGGRRR